MYAPDVSRELLKPSGVAAAIDLLARQRRQIQNVVVSIDLFGVT